jgi:hypothetical protein
MCCPRQSPAAVSTVLSALLAALLPVTATLTG